MEEQAQALLATLRKSSVTTDTKLAAFNKIKSDIKHLRVPEASQATIFECIKLAISSQTSLALVSAGLGTLGHLIKRLSLQEQTAVITTQASKLLPILLDRLGDPRESHRNAALQSLADLWPYSHDAVEKTIKEGALSGHNTRAKEMAMLWIVKLNREQGLQFRAFVPFLVANLEDADAGVRETAKSVVVELFSNAPERAKTDLKKQMTARGVRKTIESFIVAHLGLGNSAEVVMSASTVSMPTLPTMATFQSSEADFGEAAASQILPPQDLAQIEPLYVHTQRELDEMFRDMTPPFEGKESEHNWMARDKSVTKLRRLLTGNAPQEFHTAFVAGVKSVVDGILKVANSLRTTVSTNGCQLVQELARTLGPAIDSFVEILIQNFIKMSANTKPIASNNGNVTVETLLSHVSYHARLMQHMWLSFQDKNVQTRSYASGWLKILIKKHARSRAQFEHSGGLEMTEKCLKKGLVDANPKVRENTRATYWAFAQLWPDNADAIMATLDNKSKQLLEKDHNNPNAGSLASSVSSIATTSAPKAKTGGFNGRQSVREVIAAQRRAAMAAKVPERPTSAQSILSPASTISTASASSRPLSSRSATARAGATSSLAAHASSSGYGGSGSASGSLMAAPVRRPRRPELTRPATADPYAASRRTGIQNTPTMSPNISPSKSKATAVPKMTVKTPAKQPNTSPSSTARAKSRTDSHLPRPSPRSRRGTGVESPMSTPSKDDHLTMVNIPFTKPPDDDQAFAAPPFRRTPRVEQAQSLNGSAAFVDDDNFTIVNLQQLPNLRSQPFDDFRPTSSGSGTGRKSMTPRPSPVKHATDGRLHSPMQSHLRSPMVRSPQHPVSQLRNLDIQAEMEPVHVYEDPLTATSPESTPEDPEKPVLEELQHNERAPDGATTDSGSSHGEFSQSTRSNEQNIEAHRTPRTPRTHHKTTSTGSIISATDTAAPLVSNAELLRSRRLLASGLERIRTRTLEVHGFRKLQELIKSGADIFSLASTPQRYGELLLALLDYLETPLPLPGPKATALKTQVLATVRAMLECYPRPAGPYMARALASVLAARAHAADASHAAADVEKCAADFAALGPPDDCAAAVLDLLDSLHAPASPGSEEPEAPVAAAAVATKNARSTTVLALTVLSQILAEAEDVAAAIAQRLGALATRLLDDADADVRKADLELCLVMHGRLGAGGFWKALGARGRCMRTLSLIILRGGGGCRVQRLAGLCGRK